MNNKELNEVLNFIKKGATIKQIAKHYEIPLRTFTRKIALHKDKVKEAREHWKMVAEAIFLCERCGLFLGKCQCLD